VTTNGVPSAGNDIATTTKSGVSVTTQSVYTITCQAAGTPPTITDSVTVNVDPSYEVF
jgi:hypothetical protein